MSEQSYGLDIRQPGRLDSMFLKPRQRVKPGAGQVEIEVMTGALNFRDVLKALGIYPTEGDEKLLLGDECAGRIISVGEGVTDLQVGDRVAAIAPATESTMVGIVNILRGCAAKQAGIWIVTRGAQADREGT